MASNGRIWAAEHLDGSMAPSRLDEAVLLKDKGGTSCDYIRLEAVVTQTGSGIGTACLDKERSIVHPLAGHTA